ncbi:serine carboxypeptidase-like 43 isoform X2 [Medicago truncatula]|uniref:serine carboxypeptidase-like 43 isoform X2 n=1 Tax=Medicago truncatula TaxID=3880 RepID=UPI000D2F272D|nr:serine carboxypeptidase-like 43 isoform X2 [Medicago truncatula]
MVKSWFFWVLIVVGYGCFLETPIRVEGYPIEDFIVKLPGQPKVEFKQYAGYIDIDVRHGRSLFYYFVEADHDPHKKPLTLWLNGGPGCSSIGGGAFTELGPFYPTGDGRGLRRNKKSWNRASNLLFVESPAGVGWSYSNTTSDYNNYDDTSTANDTLLFMLKWYEKFPSYRSRGLFLTGESYAGHFIPQLANTILDYNAHHSTGFKFNIKGVAIGNPLLQFSRDTQATYEYYWSHGMISDEIGLTIMNDCNFDASYDNLSKSCKDAMVDAQDIVSDYIDNYDVILDVCYPSIAEQELRLKRMVQKALHANRTNLPYPWSMCSGVLNYNDADHDINILPVLKRIVQNHIPVWVYSGDQDSIVPLLGSRRHIRELAHDLNFNITDSYRVWFHRDQVGGWVTEYGNLLTFATVRGAGHIVPYAQPSKALHLFSSFVRGRRLPKTTRPKIIDEITYE